MRADVAVAERAVERVGERVQRDVGVGMAARGAGRAECARRRARRDRRARRRGRRNPGRPGCRPPRRSDAPRPRASPPSSSLCRSPGRRRRRRSHGPPRRRPRRRRSVRRRPRAAARRCASRISSKRNACGVCTARNDARSGEARMRPAASTCLIVSLSGIAGIAAPWRSAASIARATSARGGKDARAVVDEDEIGRGRALRLEPGEHASAAGWRRRTPAGRRRPRRRARETRARLRRARDRRGG